MPDSPSLWLSKKMEEFDARVKAGAVPDIEAFIREVGAKDPELEIRLRALLTTYGVLERAGVAALLPQPCPQEVAGQGTRGNGQGQPLVAPGLVPTGTGPAAPDGVEALAAGSSAESLPVGTAVA